MARTDLGFEIGVRIGSTQGNMATCKVEPNVEFKLGDKEEVVCGESVPVGYPRVVWTYPGKELTSEQYYQLWNVTQGAASGTAYIRVPTRTVELVAGTYQPQYATYQSVMKWPEDGVLLGKYNRWLVGEIEFTNLIAV